VFFSQWSRISSPPFSHAVRCPILPPRVFLRSGSPDSCFSARPRMWQAVFSLSSLHFSFPKSFSNPSPNLRSIQSVSRSPPSGKGTCKHIGISIPFQSDYIELTFLIGLSPPESFIGSLSFQSAQRDLRKYPSPPPLFGDGLNILLLSDFRHTRPLVTAVCLP